MASRVHGRSSRGHGRRGPGGRALLGALAAFAILISATSVATPGPSSAQTGDPGWLQVVNAYRTSTGLPPVVEDPSRSTGVAKHAVYLAMTGSLTHGESSASPFYSPEGAASAAKSVLGGWRGSIRSDRDLIDGWMTAPFHALHFLEPRLHSVAFAASRGLPGAVLDTAAVLDVVSGIGSRVVADRAITFPAAGSTTPLTTFVTEIPNPLTACPGYSAPAGLPLIAMFTSPPGAVTTSVLLDGQPVEHCVVDAGYTNADAGAQATGRAVLAQKNAVFLIPHAPLQSGRTYTARVVSAAAGTAEWAFTVQAEGGALPTKTTPPVQLVPASLALQPAATKTTKTTKTTMRP